MKTWTIFGATSQTPISSTLRRSTSTIWSKYQHFFVSVQHLRYLMIGAQTGATVGCPYNQAGTEGDDRRERLEESEIVTEGVPEPGTPTASLARMSTTGNPGDVYGGECDWPK